MSDGGVGSIGGAGAAAMPTSVDAGRGVEPVSGSPDSGDYKASDVTEATNKDSVAGGSDISSATDHHASSPCNNMSTESFVGLHNSSVDVSSQNQDQDFDMKKLLEMIMAMKLLEELKKE
tara:strand:+ start:25130 stop:25489 length:360 start_codon:yes stop_codon:yes gene_type:complete